MLIPCLHASNFCVISIPIFIAVHAYMPQIPCACHFTLHCMSVCPPPLLVIFAQSLLTLTAPFTYPNFLLHSMLTCLRFSCACHSNLVVYVSLSTILPLQFLFSSYTSVL